MIKNKKRNRKIPDSDKRFYATGLAGLQKKEIKIIESLLNPIDKYVNRSLLKISPHVSCRYLGYKDEISFEKIKQLIFDLEKIYKDFLPLECSLGSLFGSWECDPNYKSKLLMIKIKSPKLKLLHKEILKKTKKFPIFSKVEEKNFNPHFTLGSLKKEFEKEIPLSISSFIKKFKIKPFKFYLRKAYVHSEKGMSLKYFKI